MGYYDFSKIKHSFDEVSDIKMTGENSDLLIISTKSGGSWWCSPDGRTNYVSKEAIDDCRIWAGVPKENL